jgi:hypothetical protein
MGAFGYAELAFDYADFQFTLKTCGLPVLRRNLRRHPNPIRTSRNQKGKDIEYSDENYINSRDKILKSRATRTIPWCEVLLTKSLFNKEYKP